jgi:hypothetical protein
LLLRRTGVVSEVTPGEHNEHSVCRVSAPDKPLAIDSRNHPERIWVSSEKFRELRRRRRGREMALYDLHAGFISATAADQQERND